MSQNIVCDSHRLHTHHSLCVYLSLCTRSLTNPCTDLEETFTREQLSHWAAQCLAAPSRPFFSSNILKQNPPNPIQPLMHAVIKQQINKTVSQSNDR